MGRNQTQGEEHMNRDDIIRMARKACDSDKVDAWHNGFWTLTQEEIERFSALVAAAEREACAKVCEPQEEHDDPLTAWKIAKAIRARGQTKS
jgi:hypothetical protein